VKLAIKDRGPKRARKKLYSSSCKNEILLKEAVCRLKGEIHLRNILEIIPYCQENIALSLQNSIGQFTLRK
jgi:hypothetical protein